ncbi:MAG: tRNA (adenosine(37)-N6)-dimethylallyltransferase MiaA [Candidatus Delongbacteria bacterium]|nr:tRNA (adenosine(37)-N6)-dimethylallyltransferase MiaA [Candidatus Delongbacteria bacterium]
MNKNFDLIVVTGPTATGKTGFASALADRLDGEIISADSRQVYRKMTIGTGKDIGEYTVSGKDVPYHLIDICDAGEEYNVFRFKHDFDRVYNDILSRNRTPILCGGSGLYIESVLKDYKLLNVPVNEKLRRELEAKSDEELTIMLNELTVPHNITDTSYRKRLVRAVEIAVWQKDHPVGDPGHNLKFIMFGIHFEREIIKKRITERLRQRLDDGMVREAQMLLNEGISKDKLVYYGLEYKFLAEYLDGQYGYNDMFQKLNSAIHRFAKRQMTWFRKMERDGMTINWIDGNLSVHDKLEYALKIIGKNIGQEK